MRSGGARRLAVLGALLLAAPGCKAPAQIRYEREVEAAAPEALHGVHSERVAELMRGLDRLRGERLPTAMDVAASEETRAREIAEVSRLLALSARAIPDASDTVPLSDGERGELVALAADLEHAAEALAAAPAGSPQLVARRVERVEATCAACHHRFRIEGGFDVR